MKNFIQNELRLSKIALTQRGRFSPVWYHSIISLISYLTLSVNRGHCIPLDMFYMIILILLLRTGISKEIVKGNSTNEESWRIIEYNEEKHSNGDNLTFVYLNFDGNETLSSGNDIKMSTEENINSSIIDERDSCFNNRGYSSAEGCVRDCNYHHELFSEDFKNVTMTYKVLHLGLDEFNITENNSLFIPAWNVTAPNNSYHLNLDGSVKVCLPLTDDLLTCEAATVKLSHVQLRENGHSMHLGILDKLYNWNEFYIENSDETVICFPDEVKAHKIISNINTVASVLSAICLWMGILLSKFIPDLCKNRLLQCHMVMLAFGFVVQSCLYIIKDFSPIECVIIHAFLLFFFLSTFFWLNLHMYDLYQAIKTLNATKTLSNLKFFYYSVFAWGLPLVIVILAVLAEELNIPGLQPGYKMYCHFDYTSYIAFVYYHGWMAVSILINITLFLLILWKFHKMRQDLAFVNHNAQRRMFLVSVRLAIVMGFSWIFEVLSWAKVGGNGNVVISAVDVLVCFQGVFIFLVYICRRNVVRKILRKRVDGIKKNSSSSKSSTKSSSIHLSVIYQPKCSNSDAEVRIVSNSFVPSLEK